MTSTTVTRLATRFLNLRRLAAAAACAIAAFAGARAAEAGEPVRLLVELPSDVRTLDCGEILDIQILGIDAAGARVNFGGKTVETSATVGTVEASTTSVYKYRYRTPATLPDVTSVRIRAWLKEAPEIQGEASVDVIPPAPFKRLVITGPGSTPAGASAELVLRGETADGQMKDVPDGTVTLKVQGPGSVTLIRTSRYRYDAPSDASGSAKIVAALKRYPAVAASMDMLVTGGAGPAPGPQKPPGGTTPPPPPAGKPGGAKPPADDEDDPVAWPGGNVRLEVWRVKADAEGDWSKQKDLIKPGGEFVATNPFQKIRVVALRKDVKTVEIEETTEPTPARTVTLKLTPTKDGRFVIVDRPSGAKAIHYECEIGEAGRRVTMTLTLTYKDGTESKDTFVFRRVVKR